MSPAILLLLGALVIVAAVFVWRWFSIERARHSGGRKPVTLYDTVIGFVTNFFDTLGIGSFASTTAFYKASWHVADQNIPGTLNVGHALPTVAQALIYIVIIQVDPLTLVSMIIAAVVGAWLGAGVVARLPLRAIQIGMGVALLIAATLFVAANMDKSVGGGTALQLAETRLMIGVGVNFVLGALMTLGIGLYAPCLILVSLLGMNPGAAFPIMMGSCAFLMPTAGIKFIKTSRYNLRAALGLTIGGIPGVLIAAYIVKSLPLYWLRWLVVIVVLYAALAMLRSAIVGSRQAAAPAVSGGS